MSHQLVVHCMRDTYHVYIGRVNNRYGLEQSRWANPFLIGRDGTREEVIEKYKIWFPTKPRLVNSLPELRGKTLGCWCAPKACHGDFLAEMANK